MNARKITAAGLLAFVVASVAALGIREWRGGRNAAGPAPGPAAQTPGAADPALPEDTVIAYYFHRSERCDTCNKMEAYSQAALQSGFAEQLAGGRLQWRVVNYEEPENKHFREDFDLLAPSLVLAAMRDGRQTRFEDLPDIWILVDDQNEFVDYVQRELRGFLEGH